MSFVKWFTGPDADELERQGDDFLASGDGGSAKLAYERALEKRMKSEKRMPQNRRNQERLAGKIRQARDQLASEHRHQAREYAAGEYWRDASDMLALAAEVCADEDMRAELIDEQGEMEKQRVAANREIDDDYAVGYDGDEDTHVYPEMREEDYFLALCSTLPETIQEAYFSYGRDFKKGYTALNQGAFERAVRYLEKALAETADVRSLIPLELATAYTNLRQWETAENLLLPLLEQHADLLPVYRNLCEIYWEKEAFEKAEGLLKTVPVDLQESMAVKRLEGETWFRCGDLERARDHYDNVLERYGWNETIAVELAAVLEKMGQTAKAKQLYHEVIRRCTSCHTKTDPAIRHRYAELCFAERDFSEEILEIYLVLAQEVPQNAAVYFDRISRLYDAMGNDGEAMRFRSFAERAGLEKEE